MMKFPMEVTTWIWGAVADAAGAAGATGLVWVLAASAAGDAEAGAAAAAGAVSAAKLAAGQVPNINPTVTSSCFMLRDSTRIGTILRYVRTLRFLARDHAVCTQPHRFLAPG